MDPFDIELLTVPGQSSPANPIDDVVDPHGVSRRCMRCDAIVTTGGIAPTGNLIGQEASSVVLDDPVVGHPSSGALIVGRRTHAVAVGGRRTDAQALQRSERANGHLVVLETETRRL